MIVEFSIDGSVQRMSGDNVVERLFAVRDVAGDRFELVSVQAETQDEQTLACMLMVEL